MNKTVDENRAPAPVRRSREGSGRVRLEEVAEKAGVSTATVSRAFNQPDKVTDLVRERVLAAARSLNWIPNAAGRALASSRTQIAGAIIPTLDNEIFANQISGMQSVFSGRGYTLFLGCSNYEPAESLKQANAMLARGVEALAIVGENHAPELFEALETRNVPYVVTYSYREDSPHPSIGFDNRAAFVQIVEHLMSRGHTRFGTIFQPDVSNDRVAQRLAGVREGLARAGLSVAPDDSRIGPSTMGFGAASFAEIMGRPKASRPTAIVCGNDNIALGALMAASDMGLRAPDDFSITGFDDLAIASRFSPHLTTMKVDNRLIGEMAASGLLAVIDGKLSRATSFRVAATLMVRQSSGAPPAV